MSPQDPSKSSSDLIAQVARTVAQVVLEQTGATIRLTDEQEIASHLDAIHLTDLALALQQKFDVTLEATEINPRALHSAATVAALIERKRNAKPSGRATRTVTVLGGGKIGRMVAHLLGTSGDYRLRLADVDKSAVAGLASELGDATPHAVDFTDAAALDSVLDGADAVISCAPFYCNPLIAERAKANGAHYFDLTEDVAVTEKVVDLAEGADTAFVPQCGLAPGFITIVAKHLIGPMSDVTDLHLRVGALPRYPNNRLKYNLTWSTEGLINEYCNPCEVILDHELTKVQPLENLEHVMIDGLEYEAFNTSGGLGSLAQSLLGKVRNVNYKSLRYPGHNYLLKVLLEDLGMRDEPDTLRAIFDKHLPGTFHDKIVIYASAVGTYRGRRTQNTYARTIYHQEIDGQNWSGIQVTTAAGVCAVVDLLLDGALPDRGYVRQEEVDYRQFIANRFGRYYG